MTMDSPTAEERAALEDRDYWKQFEFDDWKLSGWTYRDSALFVNKSQSLDMNKYHVEAIRQAEAAEREACATILDNFVTLHTWRDGTVTQVGMLAKNHAKAIRARGKE
jgi:hypothetical protein